MKTQTFSGSKLESLRSRKRLTQHDLASRLRLRGFGTTQATISSWESESGRQPNSGVLPALAVELDCEIGDFFGSDDDDEESDATLSRAEMDLYLSLRARVARQLRRHEEETLRDLQSSERS